MRQGKAPRTDADRSFDDQVGERIRGHRQAMGLTQSDLARRSGVTFQQIQKYERGSNRVAASRLFSLSQALGVPMSALLGEEETDPPIRMSGEFRRLAQAFERCSPRGRSLLLTLAHSLAEQNEADGA